MSQPRTTRIGGAALLALAGALGAVSLASCTAKSPAGGEAGKAAPSAATPAALSGDARIARGRYLVHTIGCGDCHTPGTFYGAPDTTRALSGSEVGWAGPWGTVYAANLTPDSTGIARWSEDDIVNAIQKGVKPDGSPVLPPMPWPDLALLTPDDAHAIAAYLKTVPAVRHKTPALVPPGRPVPGSIVIPPPSAWDAPKGGPPGGGAPAGRAGRPGGPRRPGGGPPGGGPPPGGGR